MAVTIIIVLQVIIILGISWILFRKHINLNSYDNYLIREIVNDKMDNIINSDFEFFDMKSEVVCDIVSMRMNPELWEIGSCIMENTKDGTTIWISNDVEHRRYYRCKKESIKLTSIEKRAFEYCYQSLKKWNYETGVEIESFIENKFVK